MLLGGNLAQGVGFLAYLVTDSFVGLTLWTVVVAVGRTAFWGSYGNIVAAISQPGEREKWFGFLGALRNVGFAVGGLLAGVAITIGTRPAYLSVVLVNAVSYVVAFVLLLAVPATATSGHRVPDGAWATVLRDRPYRLLWLVQFTYSSAMMVLNFAMPVYAVTVLGLPGWVTGAVFTINTVLVGFGQGLVVSGMAGHRRWRVLVLTNLVFAASFVVMLGASALSVALGTVVVLVGSVVYTGGELLGGPVLGRARRGGRARAPARPVPLAPAAGVDGLRRARAGRVRVAPGPWRGADLARARRAQPGRHAAGRPARAGTAARGAGGHQPGPGHLRRHRRRHGRRLTTGATRLEPAM